MVNLRALTPGHVMVCPNRVVQHFRDLTELETLELFVCAKEIAKKFEDVFKIKSFSFIM
jgi:bis(5'-adenosyl)-triphosphatase